MMRKAAGKIQDLRPVSLGPLKAKVTTVTKTNR